MECGSSIVHLKHANIFDQDTTRKASPPLFWSRPTSCNGDWIRSGWLGRPFGRKVVAFDLPTYPIFRYQLSWYKVDEFTTSERAGPTGSCFFLRTRTRNAWSVHTNCMIIQQLHPTSSGLTTTTTASPHEPTFSNSNSILVQRDEEQKQGKSCWKMLQETLLQQQSIHKKGVSSLGTTSFNLVNNMVGSGLLSIPWCVRQLGGSVFGGLFLAVIAVVTWSSFALIGHVCSRNPTVRTFDDLAAVAGFSKNATKVLLALYTWLSCISYVLLTCDFVAGEGGLARFDWACTRNSNCSWLITPFRHRYAVVLFLLVVVLYPFSRFKDFSSLKAISVVSFIAMLAMMIVALDTYVKEHGEAEAESDSVVWRGIFLAHPIFLISFTAHYNAPKFYAELEDASATRFAKASAIAVFAAFFIYGFFGIVSFETFEHTTKSDVLENYSSTSKIAAFARFAMAVVVLTTYPLAFQALKGAVQNFVPSEHQNKLDYVLVLVTSFPAAVVHDIGVVLDYKGAVLGGIVSLFIPGLAFIRSARTPIQEESSDVEETLLEANTEAGAQAREGSPKTRLGYVRWAQVLLVWAVVASIGGFIITTARLVSESHKDPEN